MQKQKLIVQATEQSKNRFHPGSNFFHIMQVNDCVWSGAFRWLFGMVANKKRLTAVAQCEETRDINSSGRQTTCIITVIA